MPSHTPGDDDGSGSGDSEAAGPRIRRVLEYWKGLKGDLALPAWASVNLMDIYDVAPHVAVLDVEGTGDAHRYRYRFVGTMLVEWRGRLRPADPTGRLLDEIEWPFDPVPLFAAIETVATTARPLILGADDMVDDGFHRFSRGLFPLGDPAGRVDQVLVCVEQDIPD